MIKKDYDDEKKHVHVISYGGGTQSTALLLMALRGEVNGVIPDHIIFSDTGWEPRKVYEWVEKVNEYIKKNHGREIEIINDRNIRNDLLNMQKKKFASIPFFTINKEGKKGMARRQCTNEYKIMQINKRIRKLLNYEPKQRVKEIVHIWKGISTDEIQRVKPSFVKWQVAEHPLIDVVDMSRQACIDYVEKLGLGTPPKSSCIGCPFHDNRAWLDMKRNDKEAWDDAVMVDKYIREFGNGRFNNQIFLHRDCKPLDQVELNENQIEIDFDGFGNECEGMCGV